MKSLNGEPVPAPMASARPGTWTLAVVIVSLAALSLSSIGLVPGTAPGRSAPGTTPSVSAASLVRQALAAMPTGAAAPHAPSANPTWHNLSLTDAPPARAQEAIAYDPVDHYVVIFSGFAGGSKYIFGDTWTYAHGVWTNISATAGSPGARRSAMMAWDAKDGYIVLFGGTSPAGAYLNDTWRFVGGKWSEVFTAVAPAARRSLGLAYDPTDHEVLLFGGHGKRINPQSGYIFLNDTWAFARGQWTELHPAVSPSARAEPNLASDPEDSGVLLFGGYGNPDVPALADTWVFSHGNWTNLTAHLTVAPGGRDGAGLDYNYSAHFVLMFGGHSEGTQYNDTWAFYQHHWILIVTPTAPGPVSGDRVSWDGTDHYLVEFGGNRFPNYAQNSTWVFD